MAKSINVLRVTIHIKIFLYSSKCFLLQIILTSKENIKIMIDRSPFTIYTYRLYFFAQTNSLDTEQINKSINFRIVTLFLY